MKKIYACIGGHIVSKTDGQKHLVSQHDLPRLYGVNPQICCFYNRFDTEMIPSHLVRLYPDPTGVYKIPNNS